LTKFDVSFTVIGLNGMFTHTKKYYDNKVLYHINEKNQKQASVILEANTEKEAESKSKSLVHKSLAKLCFVFNEEGSIIQNGYTIKDLDNQDKLTRVYKFCKIRFNILDKNSIQPDKIVSMIESIKPEKKNVLDLALMYLKIGNYDNPFRLSSLFSCITVITRDKHTDEGKNKEIEFTHMESLVKYIVRENNDEFNKKIFHKAWERCREERINIEHGYPSNLVDVNKNKEYDSLANQVHEWANLVILHFIDNNQQN
jgi:hypothetical protein